MVGELELLAGEEEGEIILVVARLELGVRVAQSGAGSTLHTLHAGGNERWLGVQDGAHMGPLGTPVRGTSEQIYLCIRVHKYNNVWSLNTKY